MVNGAWCDLTLILWSLAVCLVTQNINYVTPSGSVKQVIWLWDDTEQPFRVIFVWSHNGFRKPGWVRKVSESEWDFCQSDWENLTGVTYLFIRLLVWLQRLVTSAILKFCFCIICSVTEWGFGGQCAAIVRTSDWRYSGDHQWSVSGRSHSCRHWSTQSVSTQ